MDARLTSRYDEVFGKRLAPTECFAEGVSKSQAIQVGSAVRMLGTPDDKVHIDCDLVYLLDGTPEDLEEAEEHGYAPDGEKESLSLTLSDPRRGTNRSAEWRLNYPRRSEVMARARAGDYCWIARRRGSNILDMIVAKRGSRIGARVDRLMGTGLRDTSDPTRAADFDEAELTGSGSIGVDADDAHVLRLLGVEVATPHAHLFDRLVPLLAGQPITASGMVKIAPFADVCRELAGDVDPLDPDATLVHWMTVTTELYFLYEQTFLQTRLDDAFAGRERIDIEQFVKIAKSVLNSRKTRAGGAFEAHLEAVFTRFGLSFTRVHHALADDGSKPDFLFPSRELYDDPDFQDELLTFLGAKTTAKERWMQLRGEGRRVRVKHFGTMDRDIPSSSFASMRLQEVVPVIPKPIVQSAYPRLASEIVSMAEFIDLARDKQEGAVTMGYVVQPGKTNGRRSRKR